MKLETTIAFTWTSKKISYLKLMIHLKIIPWEEVRKRP